MDLATFLGVALGLVVLFVSLLLGGVPLPILFQPEALLIVFGGTLTALLIHFSLHEIRSGLENAYWAFQENDLTEEDIVDYITDAAIYIRTKGLLAVQPLLSHVDVPFLQRGLQLIVDGQPKEHLQSQLTTELEVQFKADSQYAHIFEAAGGFAPTMGIIGAIVGLIHVCSAMGTPEVLGQGVARAFIAVLYGVGIANLFLLPLAGKLKQRAKTDWFLKSIMLHGLLAIHDGLHPALIREQLEAYVHPSSAEGQELTLPATGHYVNA